MSRWIRRLGYALGTVVVLVVASSGFVLVKSHRMLTRKYVPPTESLIVVRDSTTVARGEHLVKTMAMCVDCHDADLGGKVMVDDPALGRLVASNLTRGDGGVGAKYTDAQMAVAIRHGIKPDGLPAIVMPASEYQNLTDEDVDAIIAYVRSLPAVDRVLPKTELRFVGRALLATNQLPIISAATIPANRPHATTVARDNSATYGQYIVGISGCTGCHGPTLSGGKIPGTPPDNPPAANITPKGIGHYSNADVEKVLRTGKRPDGSQVNAAMPWKFIAGMSDAEMTALIKYLRSVPPRDFGGR